nr:MAG TPA: hypothetical protein [Caudoviricetes sp.]
MFIVISTELPNALGTKVESISYLIVLTFLFLTVKSLQERLTIKSQALKCFF